MVDLAERQVPGSMPDSHESHGDGGVGPPQTFDPFNVLGCRVE